MKKFAAALLATMATTPAFASTTGETYLGGQFSHVTYDQDGISNVEPTAIIGRIGYFITDQFALESRLGFGIADDKTEVGSVDADVEVDSMVGLYGLGNQPLNDVFSAYALIGFTRGELTAEIDGDGSWTEDDSSFSYGAGIQARFNESVSAQLEYMSYLDESDYSVSAVALGLNVHF